MRPDLMTVAKGITSAYVPLSASIVSEKVWRVLADHGGARTFAHGYTYTAHPLAAAAALTNLDIIEDEGLLERAVEGGGRLRTGLHAALADHPLVAQVRGDGLVAAVEFVADRNPLTPFEPVGSFSSQVVTECLERGLITRALPQADTVSFSPPFVISDAEIDELIATVTASVAAVAERRA
jgi:L-2,4-diaminobutyrate transaminase